ncbi:MAG TPA: GTA-gp10 family protein [Alphaproteobacteria bacterium]|nr:GTA-gp10 family protein [Alphaproteobacteria bacterium]
MNEFNPRRGDVKLALEGCEVVLRPSFGAIVQLEDRFERAIFDVARDFCDGKLSRAKDFLAIIEIGAAGEMPADLAERLAQTGLAKLVEPVGKFLAHACGIEA